MKTLFHQIDAKKFTPQYFMVMGHSGNGNWKPMTFDAESEQFRWANPSEKCYPDESIEIYDRQTALLLLGETVHSWDGENEFQYRLVPVYTGFEQPATNPFGGTIHLTPAELLAYLNLTPG